MAHDKGGTRRELLEKIVALKVQLSVLALLLAGVFIPYTLMMASERWPLRFGWLRHLPLHTFADACLVALIVAITYEWVVRHDNERRFLTDIKDLLDLHRGELRKEIRSELFTDGETIRSILSQEQVSAVASASLQRLVGEQFGKELFAGIIHRLVRSSERWENYQYRVVAGPSRQGEFFTVHVDVQFETVLRRTNLRFMCVQGIQEYNASLADLDVLERWRIPEASSVAPTSTEAFEVMWVKVNELDLSVARRSQRPSGSSVIDFNHPDLSHLKDKAVKIHYRYRAILRRSGHLCQINVLVPTRRVAMEFDFSRSDIAQVRTMDLFVSSSIPEIKYLPSVHEPQRIEVEVDGWVLPKSGVVFVWTLRDELAPSNSRAAVST